MMLDRFIGLISYPSFCVAFVSVIFESQVDAEKIKSNFLRPMPQKAQDIGMVHDIFSKYSPRLGYM